MIDKATVRQILDAADIVEVVSDYVHLTRRGANYMGLCPFHNERTPSFSVSPARGICHCFSCGKGGSPVNFLMEKEGITYRDALLRLAEKYGIKVEERELTDEERAQQSRREAMLTVNDWAMRRFRENMNATEEGRNVGLQYFYERGLTHEAIDKFRLGYALDKPTDIYDAAIRQGYEAEALMQVGLCGESSRDGRPYDRFRGRVIYPMINSAGKVIAFGGRGIKGETAKYINSPESEIYHKSNELYGIFQAKNAIVRQKRCFLVEGYMDVIGMWQSGMENVVASSGTSLTDGQVALIHRFTDRITIIYDGDSAGIHASLRAIDICLAQNMEVTLLLLPDGDDPDSFARKNTPEQFRQYVEEHEQDFISFMAHVFSSSQATTASRTEALRSMVKSIAQVSELIQRTVYIQRCSALMNVAEAVITAEVARARETVVQEHRKRRQQARIQAEYPDGNAAAQQSATSEPASAPMREIAPTSVISNVEKQVMEYVVRYGMLPICTEPDADGSERSMNVVEYVKAELTLDSISFSSPLYDRLFARILSMVAAHDAALQQHLLRVKELLKEEHEAWIQEMTSKNLSISQIETAEKKQQERLAESEAKACTEFSAEWIGHELGSDPDDELRRFVLSAITPRYTLSKYHSKNMHIETEEERLDELLPRAITEWKDAILEQESNRLRDEIRKASAAADEASVLQLMKQLADNRALRAEIAKYLGERIIIPRR